MNISSIIQRLRDSGLSCETESRNNISNLNLNYYDIGFRGAIDISLVLKTNISLEKLNIGYNQI